MRVRPRSSEKNAWLLSPPSTVLLFSSPEMPRKLINPNVPSGTVPGVRIAKLDQRRPLVGRLLIEVWLMLVEKSCCCVLMTGASLVTWTVSCAPPTVSAASIGVMRPTSTTTFCCVNAEKPGALIVTV